MVGDGLGSEADAIGVQSAARIASAGEAAGRSSVSTRSDRRRQSSAASPMNPPLSILLRGFKKALLLVLDRTPFGFSETFMA